MNRAYLNRQLQRALKQSSTLRVLLVFPLVLFLLVRQYIVSRFDFLRPWFLPERRTMGPHHQIHDRRQSWFEKLESTLGIEPPNSGRDWRVNITVIVATTQVLLITLATARVRPESILLIPTFCLYAALTLAYRQYRIYRINNLAT